MKIIIFAIILILKITAYAENYSIHTIGPEVKESNSWGEGPICLTPLELNDHGLVLYERKVTYFSTYEDEWLTFLGPRIWTIGPDHYRHYKYPCDHIYDGIQGKYGIFMNNQGVVVIQGLNYYDITKITAYYPNGTLAPLQFLNHPIKPDVAFQVEDRIIYLDDNGDMLVQTRDNTYYLQSVYDPEGINRQITMKPSDVDLFQKRFKGIRGPTPSIDELNAEVSSSGWEVRKIELVNQKGDIVASAVDTNGTLYWIFLNKL